VEKIYVHIERLLCEHDYVVVPELGGFVLQYKSSEIFESKVTPPLMTIAFNPLMKHSDGLLAIEISRAENINYREANAILTKAVKQLKEEFSHTHTIQFGKLGYFQSDENGSLLFMPTNNPNFLPANFALESVHVTALTKHQPHHVIKSGQYTNSWKKVAAIGLIALGMTYLTNHHTDNTNTANLLSVAIPNSSQLSFQPTLLKDTVALDSTSCSIATSTTDSLELPQANVVEPTKNLYHVVVGSWAGEKSATKHCEMLKSESYNTVHIIHPDKGYHVAIRSFESKDEAIKYMQDIRHTEKKFAGAWVLCQEKI
jgi:CCDC81-like prokaryotic HU domain 1/CCDC81-like prokaryotic HU domain 2